MSYEGYIQAICEKGHRTDIPEQYGGPTFCGIAQCQFPIAWANPVDQTNCDNYGFIPETEFQKLLVSAEKVQTCNLGHPHVTHHAIYRLPKEDELTRFYFCGESSSYKPIPT